MAETLLLAGLALFVTGTLYCMREARDTDGAPGAFLLPLASLSWVRTQWDRVRWAALCRLAGVALLVVGAAMLVLRQPEVLENPRQLFAASAPQELAGSRRLDLTSYVSAEEAIRVAIREDANPELSGRVLGQDFLPERVQLVDGVLSIRQGEGFFPDMEVRILFHEDPLPVSARTTFRVRPEAEQPPEIHLSRRERGSAYPETTIIRSGYRMEMQLAPLGDQLTGFLQLILPDEKRSFLSGDFNAYTSNLRYRDGRVDIAHDHPDTLEHVARSYLEGRFSSGTIRSLEFADTRMESIRGSGRTMARLELDGGHVEERELVLDRTDVGWVVRPGASRSRVLKAGDEEIGEDAREAMDTIAFADLELFRGERLTLIRQEGDPRTGVLHQMDEERVYLQARVEGSTLELQVPREELAGVLLPDGEQRILEEVARAQAEREERASEAQGVSEDATEQVRDWEALEGSRVRIHTVEGRTRSGTLVEVRDELLTLEVRAGAGTMRYFFHPDEIESLEVE